MELWPVSRMAKDWSIRARVFHVCLCLCGQSGVYLNLDISMTIPEMLDHQRDCPMVVTRPLGEMSWLPYDPELIDIHRFVRTWAHLSSQLGYEAMTYVGTHEVVGYDECEVSRFHALNVDTVESPALLSGQLCIPLSITTLLFDHDSWCAQPHSNIKKEGERKNHSQAEVSSGLLVRGARRKLEGLLDVCFSYYQ